MPREAILIADDDVVTSSLERRTLERMGLFVEFRRTFSSALEALRMDQFRATVFEPNLPGRSWYSCLMELAENPRAGTLILATAYPSTALFRIAQTIGVFSATIKPVSRNQICSAVLGEPVWHSIASDRPVSALAWKEWEHINAEIVRASGNISVASRALGIPRQTLYRKLRKHPAIPGPIVFKSSPFDQLLDERDTSRVAGPRELSAKTLAGAPQPGLDAT
jgi:ActR/RegA family two-component response regulator